MVGKWEKKYDKVMRENLGRPSKGLLRRLLSMETTEVIPLPPITRQTIIERETDTIVIINAKKRKPFILHLEFQSSNDPRMAKRMAVYDFMLYLKYAMEVVSVVIYTGYRKMNMNSSVCFYGNKYAYQLIDIREIEPELFLQSENPKEIIFAILAGDNRGGRELIINKIFTKLRQTISSESDLRKSLKELQILSSLRSKEIHKAVTKKIKHMPIVVDMRRNILFQEAKKEGEARGKAQGKVQGKAEGIKIATNERNKAFVLYLLQHTDHTIKQISNLVNVSEKFVTSIKNNLQK